MQYIDLTKIMSWAIFAFGLFIIVDIFTGFNVSVIVFDALEIKIHPHCFFFICCITGLLLTIIGAVSLVKLKNRNG
jgi:hypothetical protein